MCARIACQLADNNELFNFNELNSAEFIGTFGAAHKHLPPGKRISGLFNRHSNLIDSRVDWYKAAILHINIRHSRNRSRAILGITFIREKAPRLRA